MVGDKIVSVDRKGLADHTFPCRFFTCMHTHKLKTQVSASRNVLQTVTLLDAIEERKFDCALGGGRRDEEKARAKERFFSHRDDFGQWDPKNQRPELWNLFNGKKKMGEHFRVFPLSN